MSTPDFSALVARHRTYFRTGATRSAQWGEGQLAALRAMMTDRRNAGLDNEERTQIEINMALVNARLEAIRLPKDALPDS